MLQIEDKLKLELMGMWLWRRMLRILWTARKRNEDVLEKADTDREIVKAIRQLQMRFFTRHIRRVRELKNMCPTGYIQRKNQGVCCRGSVWIEQ